MTRTRAAAKRRRTKHERRINDETNPLRRLAQTWAWVYAEIKHQPHRIEEITSQVHDLGVDLNEEVQT